MTVQGDILKKRKLEKILKQKDGRSGDAPISHVAAVGGEEKLVYSEVLYEVFDAGHQVLKDSQFGLMKPGLISRHCHPTLYDVAAELLVRQSGRFSADSDAISCSEQLFNALKILHNSDYDSDFNERVASSVAEQMASAMKAKAEELLPAKATSQQR